MEVLQHECGIAALYQLTAGPASPPPKGDPAQTVRLMPRMLLDLQNRGQLAAGFTTYNPERDQLLETYRELGTVTEALRLSHSAKFESIMREYSGHAVIGHVRYATCGEKTRAYSQPFERRHGSKWKWFSFAFNGQLANFEKLRDELLAISDYHLTRDNDTEVILHYIAHEHRGEERPNLVEVFRHLSEKFDGAYNIVYLNAMGDMVVLRDPLGIRPLVYGVEGTLFAAASESVALQNLGFRNIEVLDPGEMILIQDGKLQRIRYAQRRKPAHCFFEWIYFANVASTLDHRSVYLSRAALGKELAALELASGKVKIDDQTIVVPVPDTAKAAADAMAHALRIPSVEGVIRNRAIGRTFIEGSNRSDRVRMKYTPLREVLEGKKILLVEDSIVRSTTLRELLQQLREQGAAREIHVRIACPPIIAPCFYGIDMSTTTELFAPKFMNSRSVTEEEQQRMAAELEADSLTYLPLASVARCIGLKEDSLCRACITADYPTPTGTKLYQLALRKAAERNTET